jgi:hypothetical protein
MQVINSDPPASPMVVQPPVTGLSSSAAPSFSYNISHSSVPFHSNREFQSSAVRVMFLSKHKVLLGKL